MGRSKGYSRDKDGKAIFRNSGKPVKPRIKADILYEWETVKRDINGDYYFEQDITPYMKKCYGKPCIYRWNIYKNKPEDLKIIYIGETKKLCPNRIKNVLKPGPSQRTNQRLNNDFKRYLDKKYRIRLEVFSIDKMNLSGSEIYEEDLKRPLIRQLIEAMLIDYYQQKGFNMLNKYGNEEETK